MQTQIARLKDSVSKYTDTAQTNKYQKQLNDAQSRISEFHARQDSAIKKSKWEFKSNGDFVAHQGGQATNGIWSLDEDRMMLFTVLGRQTNSSTIHLEGDSLTLQLDSVNYLKLSRVK